MAKIAIVFVLAVSAFVISSASESEGQVEKTKLDNVACFICKFVATHAKKWHDKGQQMGTAKVTVLRECHTLGLLNDKCIIFVNAHFGKVWMLVSAGHSGVEVCQLMHQCAAKKEIAQSPASLALSCKLCKFAAHDVINCRTATPPCTQAEAVIKAKIDCDGLGFLAPKCRQFVDKHLDAVWHLVSACLPTCTPAAVCLSGQFCSAETL